MPAERFDPNKFKDILSERGHRYKRNVVALSAALVVVTLFGVNINPSALPLVDDLPPLTFWFTVSLVLGYNAALYILHAKKDWALANDYFETVHFGWIDLATDDPGEWGSPNKTRPIKSPDGTVRHELRRVMVERDYRLKHCSPRTNSGINVEGKSEGLGFRLAEALDMQETIRMFFRFDVYFPCALLSGAAFALMWELGLSLDSVTPMR